jgi:hypothetical protein
MHISGNDVTVAMSVKPCVRVARGAMAALVQSPCEAAISPVASHSEHSNTAEERCHGASDVVSQ